MSKEIKVNKIINPKTGKSIRVNGRVYKKLVKDGTIQLDNVRISKNPFDNKRLEKNEESENLGSEESKESKESNEEESKEEEKEDILSSPSKDGLSDKEILFALLKKMGTRVDGDFNKLSKVELETIMNEELDIILSNNIEELFD